MSVDLTVSLENRTGTLADMGEALGKAGINIQGICGFPSEGRAMVHILVADANSAKRALEAAGVQVLGERSVLLLKADDRPGTLGKISRRIAEAGGNIDLAYLSTDGQLVVGADNLDRLRAVI